MKKKQKHRKPFKKSGKKKKKRKAETEEESSSKYLVERMLIHAMVQDFIYTERQKKLITSVEQRSLKSTASKSFIFRHRYCISCYFREGFIFANFASQTLAKISTSIHVYL